MMVGILEHLLNKRYGAPRVVPCSPLVEYRWNEDDEPRSCTLYKECTREHKDAQLKSELLAVYGDSVGGSLLLDSLKVSTLVGHEIYGLYQISELNEQPEVKSALELDPDICFFMDAANEWFYGLKKRALYVYDATSQELDVLGPVHAALEAVLSEWEQAAAS